MIPMVSLFPEALPHPVTTLLLARPTALTVRLRAMTRELLLSTVTCMVPTVAPVVTVPCLTYGTRINLFIGL